MTAALFFSFFLSRSLSIYWWESVGVVIFISPPLAQITDVASATAAASLERTAAAAVPACGAYINPKRWRNAFLKPIAVAFSFLSFLFRHTNKLLNYVMHCRKEKRKSRDYNTILVEKCHGPYVLRRTFPFSALKKYTRQVEPRNNKARRL